MNISVCIITKNEAHYLKTCLEHLSQYPFEIVVVDTGSEDESIDVAKSYTDNGNLVPDDVTNSLVKERLAQSDVGENGFMLDGYPRTLNQAQALDKNLNDLNETLDAVIYIEVDKEVLKDRLSGRFICRNCGATYHKLYNPPKVEGTCDTCGSHDFYQREDDKPEKVSHRIELQMDSIRPILEHYQDAGILHQINGEDAIESVYRNIRDILGE